MQGNIIKFFTSIIKTKLLNQKAFLKPYLVHVKFNNNIFKQQKYLKTQR